jgi:NTE family protein
MREDEFRGRQIFLTSVDYRVKLPFNIYFDTYALFRYDLGSMWEVKDQIRFNDLRHGLGMTLSLNTPIGPADFSIGRSFRFTKNLTDTPVRSGPIYLYFSIGYYY